MGGGILQGAAPAERWTIGGNMGGGHAGNAAALAESPRRGVLCARYQAYTRAIYGPPYSPPKAMQEPPAIPAKSHSRSHQNRGQAPQRTGQAIGAEATAEAGTTTADATSQHSTTTATPNQHSSRTAPPQADRTGAPTTATGPMVTAGPARRAVGTPGGGCEVCGFGSAKVF